MEEDLALMCCPFLQSPLAQRCEKGEEAHEQMQGNWGENRAPFTSTLLADSLTSYLF